MKVRAEAKEMMYMFKQEVGIYNDLELMKKDFIDFLVNYRKDTDMIEKETIDFVISLNENDFKDLVDNCNPKYIHKIVNGILIEVPYWED